MPTVFVSYSHDPANPEHSQNVLGLAASLMRDGLTVFIDQNRSADEEKIPLPIWMEDRIERADYMLLVCTLLSFGLRSSIRSRQFSTTSTGEIVRSRIDFCTSLMLR
jgi:hypothetical protein